MIQNVPLIDHVMVSDVIRCADMQRCIDGGADMLEVLIMCSGQRVAEME